jgi:hypothetical protein
MKLTRFISASAAAIIAAAAVLVQTPRQRQNTRRPTSPPLSIDRKVAIPTAMAAASITAWMKMSHGNSLKYTFVPSMAASLALYMLTFRKRMPDPDALAPLYFLALAWQLVHFVEENSTGFRYRWPIEIFGAKPYGERQYVAINALSYAVFIAGGVALLKRRPEFSLPAIFFAVMGVMYNGVQHPIYSYMVKGYFPGLFTGLVDLAAGPFLLKRMFALPEQTVAGVPAAA